MSGARVAMCLEQTLGHRAHALQLESAIAQRPLRTDVYRIEFPQRARVPVPWALRGSVDAWRQLRRRRYEATFFHTLTVALLASQAARGRPYVVSIDATPVQIDAMAGWYRHRANGALLESAKRRWYRAVVRRAAGIVSWSQWSADSLVAEYGADASRIIVAHPGASRALFELPRATRTERPRVLFVGGDFTRKGGDTLLEAFAGLEDRAELVLVTDTPVPERRGVRMLNGVTPGSAQLERAFAEADMFCLPTLGDCTPVAIGEAMAAGLPVVTTAIASNPEWVPPEAGILVPPGEPEALRTALTRLIDDPVERVCMGAAAREWAREKMDAAANANRVLDLLERVAG